MYTIVLNFCTLDCLINITTMAKDQISLVNEINHKFYSMDHNIILYYGCDDGWVPLDYYHDFVQSFPHSILIFYTNI